MTNNQSSTLWKIADLLRDSYGYSPSASDTNFVILYLLVAIKEEIISRDTLKEEDILEVMRENLSSSVGNWELYEFFKDFEKLYNPNHDVLEKVLNLISKIDLHENFPSVFDGLLNLLISSQGRTGGEMMQPNELTRLILGIADMTEYDDVFNPFAGLASFGVHLQKNQEYFGQEFDHSTWLIGTLRLFVYGRKVHNNRVVSKNTEFLQADSFLSWPTTKREFDLIVSHPPFNINLNQYRNTIEGFNFRNVEDFVISNSINSLSKYGKLVLVLPSGFLFSNHSRDLEIKRRIVEEDLLDRIISLPSNLLSNTGVKLNLLVLDKYKLQKGVFRFVDAGTFIEDNSGRTLNILDYHSLINYLDDNYENDSYQRCVEKEDIEVNDFNLDVNRYFIDDSVLDKIDGLKLNDIITPVRGDRNQDATGRFVNIRDLKDEGQINFLRIEDIESSENSRNFLGRKISESVLLLATKWTNLKLTFFRYQDEPIIISPNISAFKVDENIVEPAYLINELNAEYVQDQVSSYVKGQTIPYLSRADLMKIKIRVPSKIEQKAKVEGILELQSRIESLQSERNALAHGLIDRSYESFSTVKHSLGKPLMSINTALRSVESALNQKFPSWKNELIFAGYDKTLQNAFEGIHKNLEHIHSILVNSERELDFSKYTLSELDILKFVEGYVAKEKTSIEQNVVVNIDINPDLENKSIGNKLLVEGNENLLEIALNSIVENAKKHAFLNPNERYNLEFRISYFEKRIRKPLSAPLAGRDLSRRVKPFIKIEVANSGNRFPEDFGLEKFVRKNTYTGSTGNTGQGGYNLNEIVKFHNNGESTLDLITAQEITGDFSTIFSFLIPIIK